MSLAMLELFQRVIQIAADTFLLPAMLGILILGGWCAWEFGKIFADFILIKKRTTFDLGEIMARLQKLKKESLPNHVESVGISLFQQSLLHELYSQRHSSVEFMRVIGQLMIERQQLRSSGTVFCARLVGVLGILLGSMLAIISLAACDMFSGDYADWSGMFFLITKACSFIVVGMGIACSAWIIAYIRKRWNEKDLNENRIVVEVFINVLKG